MSGTGEVFEARSTIDRWDQDYYHPIALRLYDRAVPEMLDALGAGPGATVLDAGCGPGVHSIRVAQAGRRVVAIDLSQSMLDEARRRLEAAGVADRVELRRRDLTDLELPDASFRHVFSWGVIIHIPEAGRALDELARILEPGGRLALYLTNRGALDHKLEWLARLVARRPLALRQDALGDGVEYTMGGERLWLWRMSSEGVQARLAQHGLRLVRRRVGEFSAIQRRTRGGLRRALLHFNNWAYAVDLLPRLAHTQLLIFEKDAESGGPARSGSRESD